MPQTRSSRQPTSDQPCPRVCPGEGHKKLLFSGVAEEGLAEKCSAPRSQRWLETQANISQEGISADQASRAFQGKTPSANKKKSADPRRAGGKSHTQSMIYAASSRMCPGEVLHGHVLQPRQRQPGTPLLGKLPGLAQPCQWWPAACGEQKLLLPGELPAATPNATGGWWQQKGLGEVMFGLRRAGEEV